jgi:hypothetical protein
VQRREKEIIIAVVVVIRNGDAGAIRVNAFESGFFGFQ